MSALEAGQWRFSPENDARVLVVGYDGEGEVWVQTKCGECPSLVGSRRREIYERWIHIMECTGWDWIKPKPPIRREALWIIESLTGELSKKWIEVGQNFHIACADIHKTTKERIVG